MARRRSGGSSFSSVNRWAAQERKRQEQRDRQSERVERQRRSGWTPAGSQPPDVGTVADTDHVASFKTKDDQDRTIIADGDYSDDNDGFRDSHNDYGRKREGGGYFSEDRGHYTGPDH